jgi:hypothetical protein
MIVMFPDKIGNSLAGRWVLSRDASIDDRVHITRMLLSCMAGVEYNKNQERASRVTMAGMCLTLGRWFPSNGAHQGGEGAERPPTTRIAQPNSVVQCRKHAASVCCVRPAHHRNE